MASPAYSQPHWGDPAIEPTLVFVPLADIGRALRDQSSYPNAQDGLSAPPSVTRGGAMALMVALSIEGATALCLFGAWQLWRVFR